MTSILRTAALVVLFAVGVTPPAASAVSIEDLVHLKANGLSDDILIALVEADGSIFQLAPDDVVMLYKRGLGEKVILAMIATARKPASDPLPNMAAAVPAINVNQTVVQNVDAPDSPETVVVHVPVAVPIVVRPHDPPKRPKPVYWGYGGKPRPGSWQPAPESGSKTPSARGTSETR